MGKALAGGKREQVFLMTKNCERDYEGSKRCLDESLRRLQTDRIDLWQFHEMVYDSDPDWVFERGGIKAAIEAKQAGKVRHIGFTGHKDPRIHLAMLDKPFEWETARCRSTCCDLHYRSFQKQVVPVCLKKQRRRDRHERFRRRTGHRRAGRAVGGGSVPLRPEPADRHRRSSASRRWSS